jgi:uncharacterized damage-inducible protein DinB
MAENDGCLSFLDLLAANAEESQRWRSYFERQPASVLEIPSAIAKAGTVRGLLLHIFAVELRYAERLLDLPVTAYEELPTESVAALFGVGDRARDLYRQFIAQATPGDYAVVQEFPTRSAGVLRASKRKMLVHALLHSVRHWAQLAVLLRESGYPTDWQHDFLMSSVME